MKMINRAQLRGKPLDILCKCARTTRYEYGRHDNRVFCYGVADPMTEELLDSCKNCKAHVDNAEPPEEDEK